MTRSPTPRERGEGWRIFRRIPSPNPSRKREGDRTARRRASITCERISAVWCAARAVQRPNERQRAALAVSRASSFGGWPKRRAYSRLNWLGLA